MKQSMMTFRVADLQNDIRINPFHYDPMDPLGYYNLRAYVPKHMEAIIQNVRSQKENVRVIYPNGEVEIYNHKQVILNILMWRIFIALRLPVTPADYHEFKGLDEGYLSRRFTAMKYKCDSSGAPTEKILALMFEALNNFINFCHRYTWQYSSSLSLDKLTRLMNKPEIKDLRELKVRDPLDTGEVERTIAKQNKELIKVLLEHYPKEAISQMLASDTLNINQVAQMLVAYGPRSDIDDSILGIPILNGTLKGLQSGREMVLEALSAKKSAIANKTSVGDTSYQNRQGLLTTCEIYDIYDIPCGNKTTRPTLLTPEVLHNYIGKNIVLDGQDFMLTADNIHNFSNTWIDLITALDCQYQHGICKRCMGEMANFIPSSLHLGLVTGAEVFSMIVQKILSSKHLTKTNTIPYELTTEIASWFIRNGNNFFLYNFNQKWKIGFPISCMDKFDLLEKGKVKETKYSRLTEFYFFNEDDELLDVVKVEQGNIKPYFTMRFLNYLVKVKSNIIIKDGLYMVPLTDITIGKPIMKVDNVTYDMNAYVKNVWHYLRVTLKSINDPGEALQGFSKILFQKTDVNIFLAEVILKSLMISGPDDFNFPLRKDGELAYFGPIGEVISNRALTPKLVFEGVFSESQEKFFNKPSTFLYPNSIGNFAPFFNL